VQSTKLEPAIDLKTAKVAPLAPFVLVARRNVLHCICPLLCRFSDADRDKHSHTDGGQRLKTSRDETAGRGTSWAVPARLLWGICPWTGHS
jgi:hypothetical protein